MLGAATKLFMTGSTLHSNVNTGTGAGIHAAKGTPQITLANASVTGFANAYSGSSAGIVVGTFAQPGVAATISVNGATLNGNDTGVLVHDLGTTATSLTLAGSSLTVSGSTLGGIVCNAACSLDVAGGAVSGNGTTGALSSSGTFFGGIWLGATTKSYFLKLRNVLVTDNKSVAIRQHQPGRQLRHHDARQRQLGLRPGQRRQPGRQRLHRQHDRQPDHGAERRRRAGDHRARGRQHLHRRRPGRGRPRQVPARHGAVRTVELRSRQHGKQRPELPRRERCAATCRVGRDADALRSVSSRGGANSFINSGGLRLAEPEPLTMNTITAMLRSAAPAELGIAIRRLALMGMVAALAACHGDDDAGLDGPPVIATQPADQSVLSGSAASFSVDATGADPLAYQWSRSADGTTFTAIAGATGSTYSVGAAATSQSGTHYRVVVSNNVASVTSGSARLTVTAAAAAPAVTTQPGDQAVVTPATAVFQAAASGTPPPTVQWQLSTDAGVSWNNIAGATAASYTTPATVLADDGQRFRAMFSNSAATVTSNAARLIVSAPGAARFPGPSGMAFDAAGNAYVSDGRNHTVSMITPGGAVTTLAGWRERAAAATASAARRASWRRADWRWTPPATCSSPTPATSRSARSRRRASSRPSPAWRVSTAAPTARAARRGSTVRRPWYSMPAATSTLPTATTTRSARSLPPAW